MVPSLYYRLMAWIEALRRVVELHPAILALSVWPAPDSPPPLAAAADRHGKAARL